MIDEVVRSTPSMAPMRSVNSSISATAVTTTIATRSNDPLTECRARTSAIARSASTTAAICFGSTVIITWARTWPRSTASFTRRV